MAEVGIQPRAEQKGGGPYQHHYYFKNNCQVVLCGQADGDGGTGGFARWNIYLDGEEDGCVIAKFQNSKTDKYLRIYDDGNTLDVGGDAEDKCTRFKVEMTEYNSCKLESCEHAGKYVSIEPRGVAIGNGDRYTEVSVWANEEPEEHREDDPKPKPTGSFSIGLIFYYWPYYKDNVPMVDQNNFNDHG
eukprot:631471_1